MDASVMAILAWLNLLFKQAKQNQLFMIRHKPWLPHICCQWLETGFLLTAWFGFFFFFCILFTMRSLKPGMWEFFLLFFFPSFPFFFFLLWCFRFVRGDKFYVFDVKCWRTFFLWYTRLARFASFNVEMSVQESFCGRILIHELTWFWCSTMLHKDVTTWHSLYDSVKHHFDGSKLRTRYNYMRKPTHTFTRKNFICGDFHEKSTDATTKALFFRVNLILFLSNISWLNILSETDIISLLL